MGVDVGSLSPAQNVALGVISGTIEVTALQPMLYCKNAVQQGLPLSLNPMVLYVSEGCTESMAAQLMLGWLKTPFKTVTSDEGALPRLDGKGVPSGSADGVASGPEDGLLSYAEIVSFCFAIAQNKALTVVPATGRADIAAWLAAPAADTFGPLLRGKQAGDNTPCLNSWGLSMDDAAVLPVLKGLVDAGADIDARVSEYLTENFAKAGIDV